MTLKLFGGARSRASIPRWYLEERAIPYEWVQLDMQAGEHTTDAFAAINPFAKVPALVDQTLKAPGGAPLQLFESGAILLHLADHHAHEFAGTAAQVAAQRALATQWVLFANSTLAVALFVPANREREFPQLMTVLDGLLAGGTRAGSNHQGHEPGHRSNRRHQNWPKAQFGGIDHRVQNTFALFALRHGKLHN